MTNEKPYDFKDLKFNFDLKDANYELDILQEKLLQSYLRLDQKFRRAFYTDYTKEFFQYLKDKARLKEPISLSIRGAVRGGKSSSGLTIATFINACNNKYMSSKYICGNKMEYLEKLKILPQEDLQNSCFLIDEDKAQFGIGSLAKKIKFDSVMSIIAVNNISTILITPNDWSYSSSDYGCRAFGRCRKTRTNRFMLYNLQEGGAGGSRPLGMVYIPIFTEFIPKPYNEILEKEYLAKKMDWVMEEQTTGQDLLAEIRKNSAEVFLKDENFRKIEKKKQKLEYIRYKLGSEYTTSECESILELVNLLENGLI